MSGAGELAMFLAIGAAAVAMLFGPNRFGNRPPEEMNSLHARVLELEERVDFAERLLAQTNDSRNGLIGGESR